MPAIRLVDRGVIRVSGDDARDFLQNIVTNEMDEVGSERAGDPVERQLRDAVGVDRVRG